MLAAFFALAPAWAEFQLIPCGTESALGVHACCLPAPALPESSGNCCASGQEAPAERDASAAVVPGAAFCQCAHDAAPLPAPALTQTSPDRAPLPLLDLAHGATPLALASSRPAEAHPALLPPEAPLYLTYCAFLC